MTDPEVLARLEAARSELHVTMAAARAALEAARTRLAPTREETEALQEQALSGELGPDMRELAQHVEAGRTSWTEVFEARSAYAELLRDHLTAMGERHAPAVRVALETDPDFDPTATSEGV
jgi:predicted  nucleic acid-binding Zn-ribbon protein